MTAASRVPEGLIAAYRDSEYRVHRRDGDIVFYVDRYSAELASLLASVHPSNAAFITACNPYSRLNEAEDNYRANTCLGERLKAAAVRVLAASGRDPQGEWPEEPGFCALGLELSDARRLGEAFQQNAVVWIESDAVPRLILLR